MSDNYQLRKDIDSLMMRIDKIAPSESDYNLDDIDFISTNLSVLEKGLSDFGTKIITFQESINEFDDTLNGDDGFMKYLNQLRSNIYGYGETYTDPTTGEVKPCDIDHPSSSSLKGMLIDFQSQLEDIVSGDQQLAINLGQLKTHLQGFSGTLNEFKNYLTQQGIDVSKLNDGLLQVIFALNQSISQIGSHEQDLKDFDDKIGQSTDSASSQESQGKQITLYGIINDTTDTVGDENSGLVKQGNDLSLIVEGDESLGVVGLNDQVSDLDDTLNGSNGLISQVSTHTSQIGSVPSGQSLQGQITTQNSKIGTVPSGQTLQGQITTQGNKIGSVPSGKTLQGQIGNVGNTSIQTNLHNLDEAMGGVHTSMLGTLQQQIIDIYDFLGNLMGCKAVANPTERDALKSIKYKYCYVESEDKYYYWTGEDILAGDDVPTNLGD